MYSIGLDFGTNSVRALIVDVTDGNELATSVWYYSHGTKGVILSDNDPSLARQNPLDYLEGIQKTIQEVLSEATQKDSNFSPSKVIGIGVDTTGSTPMPVDENGRSLAENPHFAENPNAMAWLWKDHTSVKEAAEITELAKKLYPEYIAQCGGVYSSEWFFSKILHCSRIDKEVFQSTSLWVEIADWIPAILTGTEGLDKLKVGICAAGHKAMFNEDWGGYPDKDFLLKLSPDFQKLISNLRKTAYPNNCKVGNLTAEWAEKTGLKEGTVVAIGAFDAHLGAIGAGVQENSLVKIIGTSTCDIAIASNKRKLPAIPGLCGIVNGSVIPDYYGLEAGQSAVGDLFNWFTDYLMPEGGRVSHRQMDEAASHLKPGQSGLIALDWNNGNRTVLVDQRLSGLILGQTLYTSPAEIYRALVEATAFGALTIINRFEEYGVKIDRVINCGGIAEKSALTMQIYADVTGRTMEISRSAQTCALGAAMAGAVAAGKALGGYDCFFEAQNAMSHFKTQSFEPQVDAHRIYTQLYSLYKDLHDAFGTSEWHGNLSHVMKSLIDLRKKVNEE